MNALRTSALASRCTQASLALIERNLTPHGTRTDAAVARRYMRIVGRDAAICVMAMCGGGAPALERGAVTSLDALAAQQADESMSHRIVHTIDAAQAAEPWPVRVTLPSMAPSHELRRAYMVKAPAEPGAPVSQRRPVALVGGFWLMALARLGIGNRRRPRWASSHKPMPIGDWRFTEWFHGKSLAPMGMVGQSWNAATFLFAQRALEEEKAAW